jgi:hypothetical protein
MVKEEKLVKKVKRLLRRVGLPRWLHRFGPKRYEFWQHLLALLVRQLCQLSYRRASHILQDFGMVVPSYSALAKMAKRLPLGLWQRLLAATHSWEVCVGALDSTSFARSKPSYHYLRRIDCYGPPGVPVKVSILVDTRRKKVVAANIRVLPRNDVKDVPHILRLCKPQTLVADKGYDSKKVHELCHAQGVETMIPVRKNARRGQYRRKMLKHFRTRTYHRRELAEAMFSAIKRKFGSTIQCRRARTIRAELFAKFIANNLFSSFKRLFQQSRREQLKG